MGERRRRKGLAPGLTGSLLAILFAGAVVWTLTGGARRSEAVDDLKSQPLNAQAPLNVRLA